MGKLVRRFVAFLVALGLAIPLCSCVALRLPIASDCDSACGSHDDPCHSHVKVCHKPTVHAMACDLDHLEKHIDTYGSVVAKPADVWGQARLTLYREQFEEEMAPDRSKFSERLSGSISRSDQAYFANAMALSIAAQPKPPVVGRVSTTTVAPPVLVPTEQTVSTSATDKTTGVTTDTQTTSKAQQPPPAQTPPPKINPLTLDDPEKMISPTETVIQRSDKFEHKRLGFGANASISLEPSTVLAQKARYLNYLNQIRRTNEGDDRADAPGYALNLMRIPVSVLPGKATDVGYGCEITFTIDPVLGDDLLPTTFRNMITNDLRQQLGFPLTQALGDEESRSLLIGDIRKLIRGQSLLQYWAAQPTLPTDFTIRLRALPNEDLERLRIAANYMVEKADIKEDLPTADLICFLEPNVRLIVTELKHRHDLSGFGCGQLVPTNNARLDAPVDCVDGLPKKDQKALDNKGQPQKTPTYPQKVDAIYSLRTMAARGKYGSPKMQKAAGAAAHLIDKIHAPTLSFANGVEDKLAFPTSQIFDVIGEPFAFEIANGAWQSLQGSILRQGYAHLPDVQAYLREETQAAYQFLNQPNNQHLWTRFCGPDLVEAIRSRKVARLQDLREEFQCEVERITQTDQYRRSRPNNELMHLSKTAALAWCILVDAALLNERLIRDMKETASAKGAALPHCGDWLPYFLPNPPAEARQAFNAYVAMRWPIYVFALDPGVEEQNIADTLSTRREMQLALAIAFTNGNINARNMTRYVRRLEAQYETIAVNRTQVGFTHGDNNFGWRFYPRFQTPDTESNATVLFRDMFIGGPNRNALLRQRRLEPGPRECVALVVMPSFVPYVTVDSVANWFGLANPRHKVLDHTQAMRLSRTVKALQTCGNNAIDADCYRDGDLQRLRKRVEQLGSRLPLQTAVFPVPILNTLGGFEMFSNGATDLAPELYGWYGAPGVLPDKETTLFLVGDHFSPLRTRVIVGNKEVTTKTMLSRQVVQITVPAGVVPVTTKDGQFAQAHIASPYGVTRELLIPIAGTKPAKSEPAEGYFFEDAKLTVKYTMNPADTNDFYIPKFAGTRPPEMPLKWKDASGSFPASIELKLLFKLDGINLPASTKVAKSQGDAYILTDKNIDEIGEKLIKQLEKFPGRLPRNPNPLSQVLTADSVKVLPFGEARAAQEVQLSTPFVVEFVNVPHPVAAPPPPPAKESRSALGAPTTGGS